MAHELAGTTILRWTPPGHPATAGTAEHVIELPAELTTRWRGERDQDEADILLAAHLKVLHAITSEPTVTTGRRDGDRTRLCTLAVTPGSWRDLLAAARRSRADALPSAAAGGSGPEPASESGAESESGAGAAADLAVATVLDLTGGEPDPRTQLHVSRFDGRLLLRYRRDAFTADFADRVAGYYLAALRALTEDPDGQHHLSCLLSEAELHTQLHGLSGPRVPLPDRMFVELFEERVAAEPDRVAAVHGDRRWTYAELNERANQVAHLLLRHGLAAEGVVATVLERNLEWLAALLGIFKAGGVYLPVRPDFPPDRIATQLDRSRCRFVLTEPAGRATTDAAVARATGECATLLVAEAEAQPTDDPAVPIEPDRLAYIYFTSGSTGAPKGAMCEHAGMLNHLYAKIEDMGLGPDDVVTQLASQCFDISLWQVAAPLLVGGATMIVDTEVQLEVERFLDLLSGGGVQVIQVVPAYLDVIMTHLERRPRSLGDLRSVSVTGEALKRELVRRWFALCPDITLVNAYGATEVSDDTMHAVLHGLPERDLAIVHVGHSLRNVNTYIVDENLRVVPLGAPGEIVFSGVCVGRGYINDPERTAHAFVTDPYLPDTRLYRTGDFGRWLPEGTIEFLGRRDEQVKIRGFRIEIGEIENKLLAMPGIGEVAVIIDGDSDQNRHLVAFYTGSPELESADLRDFLAAALPDYMVPSYFHHLDELPLNENLKVNKKSLIARAAELGRQAAAYIPPATDTERRLATAWAEILGVGVGRISRADDFFALGGTSLAAVRLVVKLDRAFSLRELVAHPVLGELAALIDAAAPPSPAETAEPAETGRSGAFAGSATRSPADLLQRLSAADDHPVATLVCFPYAGGNAVNFQTLAKELEPAGITVHAVEPPGHDIARADEPLADVMEIADRVCREIRAAVPGPVMLWGHCAGAAHALATARLLERHGRGPAHVFIGALLLDDVDALRSEIAEVTALSNRQITARLHEDSAYIELDLLKSERAELVGTAFRHDVHTTNTYLIEVRRKSEPLLHAPVRVVVAADDPSTDGYDRRYRDWEAVAATVVLNVIDEGGHYFTRTRTADVAALVASCVA